MPVADECLLLRLTGFLCYHSIHTQNRSPMCQFFQSTNYSAQSLPWRAERKVRSPAALPRCLEKQHPGCLKHISESLSFTLLALNNLNCQGAAWQRVVQTEGWLRRAGPFWCLLDHSLQLGCPLFQSNLLESNVFYIGSQSSPGWPYIRLSLHMHPFLSLGLERSLSLTGMLLCSISCLPQGDQGDDSTENRSDFEFLGSVICPTVSALSPS